VYPEPKNAFTKFMNKRFGVPVNSGERKYKGVDLKGNNSEPKKPSNTEKLKAKTVNSYYEYEKSDTDEILQFKMEPGENCFDCEFDGVPEAFLV
jgi:hypothetical protein